MQTKQGYMNDFTGEIRRTVWGVLAWGLVTLLGAYLTERQRLVPGFLLGFAASIIYYTLMCFRIKRSVDLPPERAIGYMRSGWLIRLSFIVMILIISLRIPGVDFWSAVVGMFSLQIVFLLNAAIIVAAGLISRIGRTSGTEYGEYLKRKE
ncbi:MAG TPA: ATP synthase subunit I [Methylomusa anaerophila]|uniref:ATP synthase I chain n=2 Tax=Methylomusa anaerophila TaxID=1930071 RepID=A0A348AKC5_9FIRM|nr:ATP synthase subunit I [Methylomusa anaerophila]BBB91523.1 ATP synthase I chain [Methylomusa anaerophila]HML89539.1 ATP synthase subunit I [Methylomusa anaerophila]